MRCVIGFGDSAYHPWAHYAPAGFLLTINGVSPPSEGGPVLETALAGFPDILSSEGGEREKAAEAGLGGGGGARKRTPMELWQSTHVVCWTLVRRPGAPNAETPAQAPKDTTVWQLFIYLIYYTYTVCSGRSLRAAR
jgi:hypothetical protein